MKKLLSLILATVAFCVTTRADTTNAAPTTIALADLLDIGKIIVNAAPTNLAIGPYGTYVVKPKKFGYGLLAVYNFNNYVGAVAGVDHVDQFLSLSGGIQLQAPIHPLERFGYTNFVTTPFVISALGTPFGGAGNSNGGVETINSAGLALSFGHVFGGRFSLAGAAGTRSGVGAYDGTYINFWTGWKRTF